MAPHTPPRTRVGASLKTDPTAKAQKGFFSSLFSRSPQGPAKSMTRRPSVPEVLLYTPKEPPARNLSRKKSAPQDLTLNFHQSEVVPCVPRFKSMKDNLRELGLTTPVVLSQPQVAGSEAVLPQFDEAASPRADMFFIRSLSRKMSRASSQSRPESSRGNAHVASDHAVDTEQPILNITSGDPQFVPSSPLAESCSGSSSGQASQIDLVEMFEVPWSISFEQPILNITSGDAQFAPSSPLAGSCPDSSSGQASQMVPVEKIEVSSSTAPDTALLSVQNDSSPSNRGPPSIPRFSSIPNRPSTPQSKHSRTPSSTHPGPQTAPSGSSESGRTSVASRRHQRQVTAEPVSLFPVDEGFFGRPKPPPPLKIIPKKTKKHQRTQTVAASPPPTIMTHERPLTRASSTRSHTTHQTPVRRAPASEPVGLFPVPTTLTKSVASTRSPSGSRSAGPGLLPPFSFDDERDLPALPVHAQVPHERSLSRINTRATVASHQTQCSVTSTPESPPAKWTWTPPESWSGPPSSVSLAESGDRVPSSKKPAFSTIVRLRRPKSSSRSVPSIPKSVYSHANMSSPILTPSATTKFDKGPVPPIVQEKSVGPGVIVKMQGHWEEAALQDVIPHLRELKSSS